MTNPVDLPERHWARARASGAHGLRRGAWYLVVNESSKMVVLDIRKENVPVPHGLVEIAPAKPNAWSVVRWRESQLGVRRVSEQNHGLTYGVCSNCADRQPIQPNDATRMVCESCGSDLPVDWEHPC